MLGIVKVETFRGNEHELMGINRNEMEIYKLYVPCHMVYRKTQTFYHIISRCNCKPFQ